MAPKAIEMVPLDSFKGVDIYLLDQYFKGNFHKGLRILDIGCGKGRNSLPFIDNGFEIDLVDRECFIPEAYLNFFEESDIQNFEPKRKYDFIICNAVLHFSKSEADFLQSFKRLVHCLDKNGTLFIRMTSNFGIATPHHLNNGVYLLKDGTERFLVTEKVLNKLLFEYQLVKIEPIKTTLVEDLRSMTTLVLSKKN